MLLCVGLLISCSCVRLACLFVASFVCALVSWLLAGLIVVYVSGLVMVVCCLFGCLRVRLLRLFVLLRNGLLV